MKQLQQRYLDLFGEMTNCRNKVWLIKRIAWRLQARAEGGLSERALQRAAELADDADLRMLPPRTKSSTASSNPTLVPITAPSDSDRRLPPPGSLISRRYKGGVVQVEVLQEGFLYDGERFTSLSAVAKKVTALCQIFGVHRLDALVVRAAVRFNLGNPEGAKADLKEAVGLARDEWKLSRCSITQLVTTAQRIEGKIPDLTPLSVSLLFPLTQPSSSRRDGAVFAASRILTVSGRTWW
jgi:hypothetical protein